MAGTSKQHNISRNEQSSENRLIAKRYMILVGANIFSAIFGFGVVSLVSHYFGPAGFGQYSLAVAIISFSLVVSDAGTSIYAIRTVAAKSIELETVISNILAIRLALALIVFLAVVTIALVVPQFQGISTLIVFFGVTLFSNAFLLSWVPQALHKAAVFALINLSIQALNLVLLLVFLFYSDNLLVTPAAKFITETIVVIVLFTWVLKQLSQSLPLPSLKQCVSYTRNFISIGGTQLLRGLALGSDLIIIGLLLDDIELGHYAAAFKIFMLLLSFGTAYFVIILPRMAELGNLPDKLGGELKSSFIRVLPILGSGMLLLSFIAPYVLLILFGESFDAASNVLRVFCLVTFINITGRHFRQVLLARSLQTIDFKLSSISTAIHIISKITLIPMFGIMGCAIGTLLGELFLAAGQWLQVRKTLSPALDN